MSLLGSLGVNIWLLLAQVVNFLLLMWLLKHFVYTPIMKRIEKDEKVLNTVREAEKELAAHKKALEEQEKEISTKAKNRAESIIKEAEEIAQDIKDKATVESREERDAVIAQVRQRLTEIEHHGQV